MKLRWSDGHSYAETFEANDRESFIENSMAALRVFRLATGRMVHRGEIHQNEFWGVMPELHVYVDGRWLAPGHIAYAGGNNNWAYFTPFRTVFRYNHAPTADALHELDAVQLHGSADNWWRGVYDCWRWSGAIDHLINEVGDMLETEVNHDRD